MPRPSAPYTCCLQWWLWVLKRGLVVIGLIPLLLEGASATYVASNIKPPNPPREFRGLWVASVANIDWPSKPGLPAAQQQAELRALLDRAVQLRLNAVIMQVRPACDALYASKYEPWSEYLTGRMGQPPSPEYDPLAFAVAEAHARGLELHAWVNPFRARHFSGTSPASSQHLSQARPELVRSYGKQTWLDPGEPAAREHSLRVLLDIVQRYDVDGLHMDDYFYPYKEKDAAGKVIEFPDATTYERYVRSGGKLSREDWRRQNINQFVENLYLRVKAAKPWVKVGISPFGIWRSRVPPEITGLDAYEQLYADSRLWLREGWVDYFAPQLYWSHDAAGQSFSVLLQWWRQQNVKHRHVWPGLNLYRVGKAWPVDELLRQVQAARQTANSGHLLWSASPLLANQGGAADALSRSAYTNRALPPACAWLDAKAPVRPRLYGGGNPTLNALVITVDTPQGATSPRWWVVQTRRQGRWDLELWAGSKRTLEWTGAALPDVVAVRGMDGTGRLGTAAVLEKSPSSRQKK
ncbi:family 10 glycosylhydrolase [Fontisphaera persica]|uniref:glycoside hydrolase family 10 protein n=1 Tax=Fontisphaera persica TaxID=2974023 RepID=UPI0024C012D6|nr:family 10 glycosylhydrolase [Fontisphaera persica]WCJ60020.1 family 10 glycosylhydrolase [Fontisphaera persica]